MYIIYIHGWTVSISIFISIWVSISVSSVCIISLYNYLIMYLSCLEYISIHIILILFLILILLLIIIIIIIISNYTYMYQMWSINIFIVSIWVYHTSAPMSHHLPRAGHQRGKHAGHHMHSITSASCSCRRSWSMVHPIPKKPINWNINCIQLQPTNQLWLKFNYHTKIYSSTCVSI